MTIIAITSKYVEGKKVRKGQAIRQDELHLTPLDQQQVKKMKNAINKISVYEDYYGLGKCYEAPRCYLFLQPYEVLLS